MKPSGFLLACRRAAMPSLICLGSSAFAQSLYFDTDGATPGSTSVSTAVWGVTPAWTTDSTGSTATSAWVPGGDAIISAGTNATTAFTLKVNGNQTANSLTFQEGIVTVSSTDTSGNVVAGAGTLTLGAGGMTLENGLHGEVLFGASMGSIVLGTSQTWTNNTVTDAIAGTTARTVRLESGVIGTATAGNTTVLTATGVGGTVTLNGIVANGSGGGNLAITKSGTNTLIIGGTLANTYTGLTTVTSGTLTLAKTAGINAISGNANVTGGSLTLTNANQIIDSSALTISGGAVSFNGKDETLASITLTGGSFSTGNTGGTSPPSTVVVSGAVTSSGGSKITLNSGGTLNVNSLTLTGTNIPVTDSGSGNILIGGNHATQVTTLNIGAGGLSMSGQTIQVNGTTTNAGTRINLNGDVTNTGTSLIGLFGTATSPAELNMGTGTRTFNSPTANTLTVGLNIAGENLTKTGIGTLALSGNNTYTGITQVDGGIIRVLSNNALGSSAAGTNVAGGASVRLENNVTVTGETLNIIGTSTGSANNSGLVNVSGNNIWTGNVALDVSVSQNVRLNSTGGTLDIQGDVAINSGAAAAGGFGIVLTGDGGVATISGDISGTGSNQNLIKNGNSTWVLSGTNTYTGLTRVDSGVLSVSSIAQNLGTPSAGNSSINLGENGATGTLRYTGTGETVTRGFTIRPNGINTGGGTIDQSGTGNLLINGAIGSNTGTVGKALTLQGSTAGTGEVAGNITDGTGSPTSVVKAGTGTWTLSGTAKSYTGTTTVTGGRLNVSTALASTTALNVSNGTLALTGANLINNSAAVTLGTNGTLITAPGAETVGTLTVNGPSTLDLSFGTSLLNLANSSSQDWTGGLLTILGWNGNPTGGGAEQVIFGSDATALTTNQLGQIQFSLAGGLYSSKILATGEIVPDVLIVPEASAAILTLVGSAGLVLRRRRISR